MNAASRWLVLVLLFGWTIAAQAQFSFGQSSQDSKSPEVQVDSEPVLKRATHSFDLAIRREIEEAIGKSDRPEAEATDRFVKLARQASDRFEQRVEEKVSELRGDGALTLAEVTKELQMLRDEQLRLVKQEIQAELDHAPPPPVPGDYDQQYRYVLALIEYTILERTRPQQWLILVAAVVLGLMVAMLISSGLRRSGDWLKRHHHAYLGGVVRSFSGPLYLFAALAGIAFGLNRIWMPKIIGDVVWHGLWLLAVLAGFWLLWNIFEDLAIAFRQRSGRHHGIQLDDRMLNMIQKLFKLAVLALMAMVVFQLVFGLSLTGTLAGLGLAGLALTLAAQGTLKNFFATFTIYGDRMYQKGDLIKYQDYFGTIEDIGFRSTKLRLWSGHLVNIPNTRIVDEVVENVSARPYIWRRFRIAITYDTPADKVQQAIDIVNEILENHRGQPSDEQPHVYFERFEDYSLSILVQYYYTPADYWQAVAFDSEVNLQILKRFNEAGIDFAFPTQTLYMERAQNDDPVLHLQRSKTGSD